MNKPALGYPLYSVSPLRMEVDGEGVTTLVTSFGCPLDCRWCINQSAKTCAKEQKKITAEELYEKVKAHNLYYLATGGGLTFGGGEPLLWSDFLVEFFNKYQNKWKHYLETSLYVPWENIEKVIPYIDAYFVDCKSMDPNIYQKYTGCSQSLMRENLLHLLSVVGPDRITVRVPLIPLYNSKEDQMESRNELLNLGFKYIDCFSYVIRDFHKRQSQNSQNE